MKPQKINRQPPNSLRSGAEKKATSKRKRPNVSKSRVHSDPERPMAPRGNQNIIAAGTHSTQVMVNASGDEIIASNQNHSDRAELDPVTEAIPGPSSYRVLMSSSIYLYRSCAAEFIGTFLLTFMAVGTGISSPGDPVAAAIEAGFYIGCAIRTLSTISGGHVNPAISVGFMVLGQITVIRFICYTIIQTLGSAAGAALLKAVVPANKTTIDLGMIYPAPGVNDTQAIVCEMIITFFLLFGTIAMLDSKRTDVNGFAPFQIGLIIVINVFATFSISGGCMNPARSFGPSIVSGIYDKSWIYWVGDMTGAVLGALLYDRIFSTTASTHWVKADFRRCNAGDEETLDDKLATYKKTGPPDENNHDMF